VLKQGLVKILLWGRLNVSAGNADWVIINPMYATALKMLSTIVCTGDENELGAVFIQQ